MQSFVLSAAVWPQFQCQVITCHPNSTPFGGVRVDTGIDNGTNRNVVLTVLFNFYTHIGLSSTVWPQYKTRQTDRRQTDGAIGIDENAT